MSFWRNALGAFLLGASSLLYSGKAKAEEVSIPIRFQEGLTKVVKQDDSRLNVSTRIDNSRELYIVLSPEKHELDIRSLDIRIALPKGVDIQSIEQRALVRRILNQEVQEVELQPHEAYQRITGAIERKLLVIADRTIQEASGKILPLGDKLWEKCKEEIERREASQEQELKTRVGGLNLLVIPKHLEAIPGTHPTNLSREYKIILSRPLTNNELSLAVINAPVRDGTIRGNLSIPEDLILGFKDLKASGISAGLEGYLPQDKDLRLSRFLEPAELEKEFGSPADSCFLAQYDYTVNGSKLNFYVLLGDKNGKMKDIVPEFRRNMGRRQFPVFDSAPSLIILGNNGLVYLTVEIQTNTLKANRQRNSNIPEEQVEESEKIFSRLFYLGNILRLAEERNDEDTKKFVDEWRVLRKLRTKVSLVEVLPEAFRLKPSLKQYFPLGAPNPDEANCEFIYCTALADIPRDITEQFERKIQEVFQTISSRIQGQKQQRGDFRKYFAFFQ